jgi:hypothetical protein
MLVGDSSRWKVQCDSAEGVETHPPDPTLLAIGITGVFIAALNAYYPTGVQCS